MKIGYARVSTQDQNLDMQIDALTKYGCEIIYQEKVTGTKRERPELDRMLTYLRPRRYSCGLQTRPHQPLHQAFD